MNTTVHPATQNTDDSSVCPCRYVRKKAFIETVRRQNLRTIEEVRAATFINTSCGCCYETVQAILNELHNASEPCKG